MLWYTLSLCPKCKDRLMEQITNGVREEDYKIMYCPNCGSEMELALSGREKAEERTYKIILKKVHIIHGRKDKCLKTIMQIGSFDEKEALEKLDTEGSVIFEGDLLHTYLSLRKLDEIDYMVDYNVKPNLPYMRDIHKVCPDCDEEAVYRLIELDEDKVEDGFFCEKCNRWVWRFLTYRYQLDMTTYHLRASLKGIEDEVKQRIIDELDIKIIDDQIVEEGLAEDLHRVLEVLKTYDIEYETEPPYPHRVSKWIV